MWLFTKHGFYSVVTARGPTGAPVPEHMMVRARRRDHLQNLLDKFPEEFSGRFIVETTESDYRFRLFLLKEDWIDVAAQLAAEITYNNFKDQIADQPEYAELAGDVWLTMYGLQEPRQRYEAPESNFRD